MANLNTKFSNKVLFHRKIVDFNITKNEKVILLAVYKCKDNLYNNTYIIYIMYILRTCTVNVQYEKKFTA